MPPAGWVLAGEVGGVYGVRGWVKVRSDTENPKTLFEFPRWKFSVKEGWSDHVIDTQREHGNGFVAHVEGIDDRDEARRLVGAAIAVEESEFPELAVGEYYWSQLQGLEVFQINGRRLGKVERLLETGVNDVVVVRGDVETLIPYVPEFVKEVNLENNRMIVDWESEDELAE